MCGKQQLYSKNLLIQQITFIVYFQNRAKDNRKQQMCSWYTTRKTGKTPHLCARKKST